MKDQSVGANRYLPLISVIIPVYNVAKVLERCVESVRKQIYPNLEIILVDDGSTDMSGKFCDVFAKKDARVRVVHQANQGLSVARNAGLKLAAGKWITFVDSDDTIQPEMIDLLHRMCYEHRTKMSICGYCEIREGSEGKNGGLGKLENSSSKLNGALSRCDAEKNIDAGVKVLDTLECLTAMLCEDGFSMSAWGKLYARELFDLVQFPERRLYEDVGTTYRLVMQCPQIAVSKVLAYNYYQNTSSITQQDFTLRKMDLIDLTDQMCDDLLQWGKKLEPREHLVLENLTKKRRMHARFSILRQIVMLDFSQTSDPTSIKLAQQNVVKYLRKHKNDVLKNPLASRRDKLAMRSLQCGLPVFKMAWQKYAARKSAANQARK